MAHKVALLIAVICCSIASADDWSVIWETSADINRSAGKFVGIERSRQAIDRFGQPMWITPQTECSCVYLGERMVLTCGHAFRDQRGGLSSGQFPGLFVAFGSDKIPAKVIDMRLEPDLALLQLQREPTVSLIPLAETNPNLGDSVHVLGIGPTGYITRRSGWVANYLHAAGPIMESTVSVTQGDSGGPLVNDAGELVGIVSGNDRGGSVYTTKRQEITRYLAGCGVLQRLRARWADFRQRRATIRNTQWQQCQPGQPCPPRSSGGWVPITPQRQLAPPAGSVLPDGQIIVGPPQPNFQPIPNTRTGGAAGVAGGRSDGAGTGQSASAGRAVAADRGQSVDLSGYVTRETYDAGVATLAESMRRMEQQIEQFGSADWARREELAEFARRSELPSDYATADSVAEQLAGYAKRSELPTDVATTSALGDLSSKVERIAELSISSQDKYRTLSQTVSSQHSTLAKAITVLQQGVSSAAAGARQAGWMKTLLGVAGMATSWPVTVPLASAFGLKWWLAYRRKRKNASPAGGPGRDPFGGDSSADATTDQATAAADAESEPAPIAADADQAGPMRLQKTGYRLEQIPVSNDDHAYQLWCAHSDGNIDGDIARYNAYLQTLDDIEAGTLKLPEIEDQAEFAGNIRRHVRKEFLRTSTDTNLHHNKYHQFMYAWIVQQYLRNVRDGLYAGNGATEQKLPHVADAIEDHVDTILSNQLLETS